MKDQVSYPYKTTGNIVAFYVLIFKSLQMRCEDK